MSADIDPIDDIKKALQIALYIELSTIPPYLCALWSLEPGRNSAAARGIHEVVMQEMLHMTLVANVMNALKAKPVIADAGFVPRYPGTLPHSDGKITVDLGPFSNAALETFRKIEQPAPAKAPPQPDKYNSIAQFYESILEKMAAHATSRSVWTGIRSWQVQPNTYFYGSGGDAIEVHDYGSAKTALETIMFEGEGLNTGIWQPNRPVTGPDHEFAHFFRFDELYKKRRYKACDTPKTGPTGDPILVDYGAVLPMRLNPKAADYPAGSELRAMTDECSRTYTALLKQLQAAFSGNPSLLMDSVVTMKRLGYQAIALMNVPYMDGLNAGPSFEWRP